jgi:hypothetical protein
MKNKSFVFSKIFLSIVSAIGYLCVTMAFAIPDPALASDNSAPPEPYVAIHVSELTRTLETWPALPPTPTGPGTSGFEWWYTSWPYSLAYESLEEALRSDGTPFVEVGDSEISAGQLLNADGSPRYPILISLASEAVADDEIIPLLNYVKAGGFLLVGSSSFTRTWNGFPRGDFALAKEMGLHLVNPDLFNWYDNTTFTKVTGHPLTAHIPSGTLTWRMPLFSEQIPWGLDPGSRNFEDIHNSHYAWQVTAGGATILAQGDLGPFLTVKNYGRGQIIWHGAFQPMIGHGGFDPGMYAYLVYRQAIEWAFQTLEVPIIRLSPWRYPYDAALMVRHDFENDLNLIKSILPSAQFETAFGVKGDYYFCTGALRTYNGSDRSAIFSELKSAISDYGATIGSHNGGLKNPVNPSLLPADYDYWHWGPDEALDQRPEGYTDGFAYALNSILMSFQDLEGWFTGLDNGRAGCGGLRNCPRTWASPFFNSTREPSMNILQELGSITMGEQKISPFPHWTLSYETPGLRYSHVSIPVSDWFLDGDIAQSLEMHTVDSIKDGVDFYYNLGALINFYGHQPSNNGSLAQEYVTYSSSKPDVWSTNAVGIYDWWSSRSQVLVNPDYFRTGSLYTAAASISGAIDTQTAVEIAFSKNLNTSPENIKVRLNGTPINPPYYRMTNYGALKILVGSSVSTVEVQYTLSGVNLPPVATNNTYNTSRYSTINQAAPGLLSNDTDPEGDPLTATLVMGPSHGTVTLNNNGSFIYTPVSNYVGTDSFTYTASDGTNASSPAMVTITILPVSGILQQVGNQKILNLWGTNYQMGYAHGYWMADQIRDLIDHFMIGYLSGGNLAAYIKLLTDGSDPDIYQWQPQTLDEINGIADGMAASGKNIYVSMLGRNIDVRDIKAFNLLEEFLFGCTSFGVWGRATAGGETILARNFDFPYDAQGSFVNDQIIMAYEPTGKANFVSFAWPGLVGVFSGLNEAGVTVLDNVGNARNPYSGPFHPVMEVYRNILEQTTLNNYQTEPLAIVDSFYELPSEIIQMGSPYQGYGDPVYIIEQAPDQNLIRYPVDTDPGYNHIIATNHFLKVLPPPASGNSVDRYQTIKNGLMALYGSGDRKVDSIESWALLDQVADIHAPTLTSLIIRPNKLEFDVSFAQTNNGLFVSATDISPQTYSWATIFPYHHLP